MPLDSNTPLIHSLYLISSIPPSPSSVPTFLFFYPIQPFHQFHAFYPFLYQICIFGIFGHIWHIWVHIWARAIWSSGVSLKRSCKMQFRRVGLRSIGPSSQKLWPNLIFADLLIGISCDVRGREGSSGGWIMYQFSKWGCARRWERVGGTQMGVTLWEPRGAATLPPNHPQDHRRLITFGGKTQIVHKLSRFILFPLYWKYTKLDKQVDTEVDWRISATLHCGSCRETLKRSPPLHWLSWSCT